MTDHKKITAVVIDDEVQIRRFLRTALEAEDYFVFEAETGQAGLNEIVFRHPDAVILDLGLPDMDGITVLRRLREWSKIPVLILSVRQDVDEKVAALDAGADDYLTKPFHAAELIARLRVIRRHALLETETPFFKSGSLKVDLLKREVTVNGREVRLTATEYALLCVLLRHGGKVITHHQLLLAVWGPNATEHSQYIRVYVNHLRKKIELDPALPKLIKTEPGVGYRMILSGD